MNRTRDSSSDHNLTMRRPRTATPLRIGILGAARVAAYALIEPARANGRVSVAAVAARDPARAKAYAAEHGIARVHESYASLIGDPELDLVYVATPPCMHAEQAIAVIDAGKAVLVEKPFAMNEPQAQAVFDLAAQRGVTVFEAMHSPHHMLFGRMLEIVAGGEIGQVRHIDAEFGAPIAPDDPIRWRADLGGGALMDLGVYPLAWVRRLAGEAFVVTRATAEFDSAGADASFGAWLQFASGISAEVRSSMTQAEPSARLVVEGTQGRLEAMNPLAPQLGHALNVTTADATRTESFATAPSTYESQLLAVCATLLDGRPFAFPADDYVRSMKAIDAVRAATPMSNAIRDLLSEVAIHR